MIHLPLPAESDCVLLLLRHGATENNLADPPILQGRGINIGLSDHGHHQASAAGELLRHARIDAVYASPLIRAQETAAAVAAVHELSVGIVDDITEVDVGDWEYRSWVNIRVEDPVAYQNFMADPATHGYLGGESLSEVHDRVIPAVMGLMQRHQGQTIAVVAHNVVNRVVMAHGLGLPIRAARTIAQDNCGVNVLKYSDGELKVKTLNASFHLP